MARTLPHAARAKPRGGLAWPCALLAQPVEHLHGKEGVGGSRPPEGFIERAGDSAFCVLAVVGRGGETAVLESGWKVRRARQDGRRDAQSERTPGHACPGRTGQPSRGTARRLLHAGIVLECLAASADSSPWLTLADAAAYLAWSRQRLYKRRDVPRYKHGARVMYRRDELDAFLESHAETPPRTRR